MKAFTRRFAIALFLSSVIDNADTEITSISTMGNQINGYITGYIKTAEYVKGGNLLL